VATVAGATLAVGTGLLVWALYALLAGYFVMPAALALTGLAVWLVVGGGAWLAISAMRRKS
jgi:xanthosine utilization system XapX-like protein